MLPDLYVYTAGNWADGVCLSSSPSVISQENDFDTDDCLYLSFAVANGSTAEAGPFAASVYLDGTLVFAMESTKPMGHTARSMKAFRLGALSAGEHAITIVCDDYDAVRESDETNNTFKRTFTILQGESKPSGWLLPTLWKQRGDGATSYEYNALVPEELRTGCTSVAVGQILQYWWQKGYEISLHVKEGDFFTVKTLDASFTVDVDSLQDCCGIDEYELDALLTDTVFEKPNMDSDGTIAALELLCMLSMHSTVKNEETTTVGFGEGNVLERAGFDFKCVSCDGGTVPWDRIRENIIAGMPVLAGFAGSLNHTVVIDGYDRDTDSWHVNFGWGAADFRRYDADYGFDIGNGWYSQPEMENFRISTLTLDICPIHENTSIPATTIDWGWKLYDALEPEAGFLVTVRQPGVRAITLDVAESGLNVLASESGMVLDVESVTGIALEHFRALKVVLSEEDAPALLATPGNGFADIFFTRTCGVWGNDYLAENVNSGDRASLAGLNRICDIFCSANESSVLYLTDDGNGDALFADDIYTESYEDLGIYSARFADIREIRAGAGDDLVDLTSGRFGCGDGLIVRGGSGDDVLWGGGDGCRLFGDSGNDSLTGTAGSDLLVGGSGNDVIQCLGGEDILCFGADWGNDLVLQQAGGKVTLWFAQGDEQYWDAQNLRYAENGNIVSVDGGIQLGGISLKFGDDGSELYSRLCDQGAFLA